MSAESGFFGAWRPREHRRGVRFLNEHKNQGWRMRWCPSLILPNGRSYTSCAQLAETVRVRFVPPFPLFVVIPAVHAFGVPLVGVELLKLTT